MLSDTRSVAIVLVNWNGRRDTLECLRSLQRLDYPDFRTIVVDNASTDDTVDAVCSEFGDVEVIEAESNLGFAGGNNLGIARALETGADCIWLLNNDTTVEERSLSALVEVLESDAHAGIAGSKLYFYDQPNVIWFAGGTISPIWGFTRHIGENEIDTGQYDQVHDIDYATGASLLIRAETVRDIGPMDEDYFLYWEETDWCERARAAGWRVLFAPASRVWHKVGASIPSDRSFIRSRYEGRNRVRFFLLNRPAEAKRIAWRAQVNALYLLLKGRPRSAFAMMRGVHDAFNGRTGIIDE